MPNPKTKTAWRPKKWELYWYVDGDGVVEYNFWEPAWRIAKTGNYFRTKREALSAAKKVRTLLLSMKK